MSNINNSKLQELLDKQAITEVLHQYCRGADRCDEELMMSCYHPDATDQPTSSLATDVSSANMPLVHYADCAHPITSCRIS